MANGGGISFDNPIPRNMEEMGAKLESALWATMQYWSPRVQSFARANAPWTDRTGNARQGLFAKPTRSARRHRITVFHSVPYGIWLEVAHSGTYQIIMPTVQNMGPQVMRSVQQIIGRLSG